MTKLLLNCGCSQFATDDSGNTPLHLAAKSGSEKIVQVLLHESPPLTQVNKVLYIYLINDA